MRTPARHLRLVERDEAVDPEDLLARAKRQDHAAQTAIFRRHAGHVASVLANFRVRADDLPDVVQEVFHAAFKSLDRVEDASSLRPWLTGIAVHKARHALRARRRRWWLWLASPAELPSPLSHDAPPEVRDAVRATDAALASLDEEERIAFVLRFLEGMTIEEIATALDVSPATVKRRIARARREFMALARRDPRLSGWVEPADETVGEPAHEEEP
jgi:RNA polymerase sigma-70 factor (ECF subfamily)